MICLILFISGFVGINNAPPRSALSYTMGWLIGLSLAGALLSLVLFLRARAVGAADKRQKLVMETAEQREIYEPGTAVGAGMADQNEPYETGRAAARALRAEAKQARNHEKAAQKAAMQAERREQRAAARAAELAAPRYGWVETRRTYRRKTIFGNRRSETIVTQPSQRNARRRTRQRGGVTITEEWRRLDAATDLADEARTPSPEANATRSPRNPVVPQVDSRTAAPSSSPPAWRPRPGWGTVRDYVAVTNDHGGTDLACRFVPDDGGEFVPIVLHDSNLPELGEYARGIMRRPEELTIRVSAASMTDAEEMFRRLNHMEPAERALMYKQGDDIYADCGWAWTPDYKLVKAAPGLIR